MVETSKEFTLREMESREMIRGEQLFCERDERVLFRELTFSVCEGQVLQIRGSNGSGKTTLLRIICGLHDDYLGTITWYGKPIDEQRDGFFSSLTYLGHRVGVNKVLTPMENLRWVSSLHHQINDKEIYDALANMGLKGFEQSQCFTLSAGQQQRVSLSRLMLNRSKLWILDEPFATLDTDGIRLLENLLREHADQGGTALVTTHHHLSVSELSVLELG